MTANRLLYNQLLQDIESLRFQLSRIAALIDDEESHADTPPEPAERRVLAATREVLDFLVARLQTSRHVLTADPTSETLAHQSPILAMLWQCVQSLVRFMTRWRRAAQHGAFVDRLPQLTARLSPDSSLDELSYVLSFVSHAGHMDWDSPISIQVSMLEAIEMVFQPVDNHITLMVASQDWDTNTNPFSMLRVAHEVMSLVAGAQLLSLGRTPRFVLAPHCKTSVGRGPMMCHVLMFAMLTTPRFSAYRSAFNEQVVFLLGPKPINLRAYQAAISDAAAADSLIETDATPPVAEDASPHTTDASLEELFSDPDELTGFMKGLLHRFPMAMAYRVPMKPADSCFQSVKRGIGARYGHIRNAPRGARQPYPHAIYTLRELRAREPDEVLDHVSIVQYLRSKRKMGYARRGKEGKMALIQVVDRLIHDNEDSLCHRAMRFRGKRLAPEARCLLSVAMSETTDAFFPDGSLTTRGWYSRRRAGFEETMAGNHSDPGSSRGTPVLRVRALQGRPAEHDERAHRRDRLLVDRELREQANTALSDASEQEKEKLDYWLKTMLRSFPNLDKASAGIRQLVMEQRREMPFKELQKHVRQYVRLAIRASGDKTCLGEGPVYRERIRHITKVLSMWLRQSIEPGSITQSDEELSEHLMMLPSRTQSSAFFSRRGKGAHTQPLPPAILDAVKRLLGYPMPPLEDEVSVMDLPTMPASSPVGGEGIQERAGEMHRRQNLLLALSTPCVDRLSHDDLHLYRDVCHFLKDRAGADVARHALRLRWESGRLPEPPKPYLTVDLRGMGFCAEALYFKQLMGSMHGAEDRPESHEGLSL